MVHAEAARAVDAEPREVLEFCLDLESYLQIDRKIIKVYECLPSTAGGDFGLLVRVKICGPLRPKLRLDVHLDRWKSITFRQTGGRLTSRFFELRGEIRAEILDEGTLVASSYQAEAKGLLQWPVSRLLKRWLQRNVELELDHLAVKFNPDVVEIRRDK
ncbi:MAG: SRPBCC family protein [Acidimicrobiales bacterium]